jgi:hypothetical protein
MFIEECIDNHDDSCRRELSLINTGHIAQIHSYWNEELNYECALIEMKNGEQLRTLSTYEQIRIDLQPLIVKSDAKSWQRTLLSALHSYWNISL